MAKVNSVAKATTKAKTDGKAKATPLTNARAKELLDVKNGKGSRTYELGGIVTGVKGHPSRTYVYAYANAKQTPTIFWAKGDVLSARTKTHAREERLAVRKELDNASAWLRK
jgi:hypothetical protein